jgi:hypothetical protein
VGAPKSATTFFRFFLNKNKQIYIPEIDSNFWGDDINNLSLYKNMEDYLKIFGKNLEDKSIICGEKTPFYFISEHALKSIYNYNNNAKIIIVLRNPIDAVYSYHNHNKVMGFEPINDFTEAWKAQQKRKISSYKIPYFAKKDRIRYQYKYIYSYDIHLEKILKIFTKENVKIILFDELISFPEKTIYDTFDFLNVQRVEIKRFYQINKILRVNIKKNFKNKLFLFINLYLKDRKLKIIARSIKSFLGIKSFAFLIKPIRNNFTKSKLDHLQRNEDEIKNDKSTIDPMLRREFEKSIYNLSNILKKDLTHWLTN